MRFMFLIQSDQQAFPTPEMMTAMHEMATREIAAGRMIADGGLAPAAAGKRARIKGRKLAVTDGPFIETKEVIGGFAIFELPDMEAAVESARAFMQLHLEHMPGWEGVCEIRQIAGSQVEMITAAGAAPCAVAEG
jgi:hypothetical protein